MSLLVDRIYMYLHVMLFRWLYVKLQEVCILCFIVATPEMSYTSQAELTFLTREYVDEKQKKPLKRLVIDELTIQQVYKFRILIS